MRTLRTQNWATMSVGVEKRDREVCDVCVCMYVCMCVYVDEKTPSRQVNTPSDDKDSKDSELGKDECGSGKKRSRGV
jgi:hypothetical protein